MSNKLISHLEDALKQGDANKAISTCTAGISKKPTRFISQVRKRGVFRSSRYDFEALTIKKVVQNLLQGEIAESIPKDDISYLESIISLLHIAFTARSMFKKILNNLSKKDFKACLVSVEWLFWKHHQKDHQAINQSYKYFSKEELAEAFSFMYYLLCNKYDPADLNINLIDTKAIKNGYYLKKLSELSKLLYFKRCELLIDCFGYKAIREKSVIVIKPPCPRFEQSRKLGYIHNEMQTFGDYHQSLLESEGLSLAKFAQKFSNDYKDFLFSIKTTPAKRIVLQIPVDETLKEIFTKDSFFNEEVAELRSYAKEYLLSISQIESIPIYEKLTIIDVIKFQRLVRLIYWTYEKFIFDNDLKDSELFLQSVLPVYTGSKLTKFLEYIYGEEKAKSLIELLSWKTSSQSVFDLQSSPIIRNRNWSVFPIGLVAQTNLVRNVLQRTRFRFDSNSDVDPVGEELFNSLEPHSTTIHRDLSYNWGNIKGELDVLALIDKKLFVFECKNSLHPCSPYELRTSYDYIKKAGSQLSRFKNLFKKSTFRDYMGTLIDIKISKEIKIVTCIAMGNRMFSGWEERGHQVRPVHELCNIIDSGIIAVRAMKGSEQNDHIENIKLWENENFCANDLENYIYKDSLHIPRFNNMLEIEEGVQLKGKRIIRKSYAMDLFNLHKEYSKKFKIETFKKMPFEI